MPWRRERLLPQVFWPGEFRGLYSPWGRKELDMTERLSLHSIGVEFTYQTIHLFKVSNLRMYLNFYWSIVDLQGCVSFHCTAVNQLYIYQLFVLASFLV